MTDSPNWMGGRVNNSEIPEDMVGGGGGGCILVIPEVREGGG